MEQNKDQIIGIVKSAVFVKAGETNGRKWEKFRVVINDETFTAFDKGFISLVGKEGTFDFRADERGKTLLPLGKVEKKSIEEAIFDILRRLEFKAERIEGKIDWIANTMNPAPEPADIDEPENKEDLPF